MNSNPLFSIIIPTYNHAHLIGRCLKSIITQTYSNWEAIVVNNFSEDNTIEVVESFNDSRIRLINNANNGIIAVSRNKGIIESKGEWICFLDSDDWWDSHKLEVSLPFLYNCDFIYTDFKVIFGLSIRKIKIKRVRELQGDVAKDLIIYGNAICNSSVMVRKKVVDNVGLISEDKNFIAVEDFDYWIRVAQNTNKFCHIPQPLTYYWIGGNLSISAKQIERETFVYNKYREILTSNEDQELQERTLHFRKARVFHQSGDFKSAISEYKKLVNNEKSIVLLIKSLIGLILCVFHIYR